MQENYILYVYLSSKQTRIKRNKIKKTSYWFFNNSYCKIKEYYYFIIKQITFNNSIALDIILSIFEL